MRLLRLVLICAVFTVPGLASTLNYSESSPGPYATYDLPGVTASNPYPFLGYLDVGTNTVSGWIQDLTFGPVDGIDQDSDTFLVVPLAGTEVISEEIQFSFMYTYAKDVSITTLPIAGLTNISGSVDTTITPASPITGPIAGDIEGTLLPICTGPGGTSPCTYNALPYTITYTVQAIPAATTPEPSSLVLLGTGLAGLTGMLKRRLTA